MRLKPLFLILMLFLSLFVGLVPNQSVRAVWINPGVYLTCINENYSVIAPINFTNIILNPTNITFNGMGFNLTAPSKVYVNFSTITNHPLTTVAGDTVFSFLAYTSGIVTYNISGLKIAHAYNLTNGSTYKMLTSSLNGKVEWIRPAPGVPGTITYILTDPSTLAALDVTTNATTGRTNSNATLQGYLVNTGTPNATGCHVWFQYGHTTSYGTNTTQQTKDKGNAFSQNIIGLTVSYLYHYRAVAYNGASYDYGTDMNFTTSSLVNNPYGIKANWTTSTTVNLTWTKGGSTTKTIIVRKTGSYPTSITDGATIYDNTGTYCNDTSKSPIIRYFYRMFGWNASGTSPGVNVSFVETDNTSITTSSSALFKGWMATDKNIWTNFRYATNPTFTITTGNSTYDVARYDGVSPPSLASIYENTYRGQTFKTDSVRRYVYGISVRASKTGVPGLITMDLYLANGTGIGTGLPTGVPLSSGTFTLDEPMFVLPNYLMIGMTTYYLLPNTKYVVIMHCAGSTINHPNWAYDIDIPLYPYGNRIVSVDGGTTYINDTVSTSDFVFAIYVHTPYSSGYEHITSNITTTTTGLLNILQNSLSSGQIYYYKASGNDTKGNNTKGNMRYTLTNPVIPVFLNLIPSFTNSSVKITWIKGVGANRTVVVRSNTAYPTLVTDGTIEYNDTGSLCWVHNISFNMTYYFSLFSFTSWGGLSRFSSGVHIPWGGITFIVYNESKPRQVINASILVTDSLGLHPVQFNNIYGYYSFNISQIPYGENTHFWISNISYSSRLYPITIIPNIFYNFSFYLPPLHPPGWNVTPSNTTGSYTIYIINEQNNPVDGALVKIYRYLNTTANYTYIGGFVSDGYGMGSIILFPYQLYMIKITKDGYQDTTSFWTPNLVEQTISPSKTFKIYYIEVTPQQPIYAFEDITFTGTLTFLINSTYSLSLSFNDIHNYTTATILTIVAYNFTTNTTIPITTYTVGNIGPWTRIIYNIDRNMTYICNLTYFHQYLGTQHLSYILEKQLFIPVNKTTIDNLLLWLGIIPFGAVNLLEWIFFMAVCYYTDARDAGKFIVVLGVIFLFIGAYVGIHTMLFGDAGAIAGGSIPALFITMGVLMEWNQRKK